MNTITLNTSLTDIVEPLIDLFEKNMLSAFDKRVISIFKLGSLGGHGDFSNSSDVDLGLMLNDVKHTDYFLIKTITEKIKSSKLPFSDRLSVFWSSYNKDHFSKGVGRFPPMDRFDLIQYGTLTYGVDRRHELSKPAHDEIVLESTNFIESYMLTDEKLSELKTHPEKIIQKGARYLSKFILFPVRLLFTLDHLDRIGSNKECVEYFNMNFKNHIPNACDLINMAYDIRKLDSESTVNVDEKKLQQMLIALYSFCIDRYVEYFSKTKNIDVVKKLDKINREVNSKK